ncbi:MAG: beta-carotene ketolase [Synechococcales cyanobacterium CRU_2_2]|nr:beta-carotene ketolase [Synechococcales cyanobacterium CRU_2_2]
MFTPTPVAVDQPDLKGLLIALAIVGTWICNLAWFLSAHLPTLSASVLVAAVLLQTFLNTGLFVTAHDAIHGSVYPADSNINRWVGELCAIAYACLPYQTLATNHKLHHRDPTSTDDPDFNPRHNVSFLACYVRFIRQYWGWRQFLQLTGLLVIMAWIFQLSPANLAVFWGIPSFLSSLQLFYFGTYRPHQSFDRAKLNDMGCNSTSDGVRPHEGCCAKSDPWPWLLSLLTCYHFGYHQEHHDRPDTPWWGLPQVYRENR